MSRLRGEVGWHNTQCNRWVNMCQCWNRLIRMLDFRLTFKMFEWDISQVDNYSNWSSELTAILTERRLPEVFVYIEECNLDILKRKCAKYNCNKWKVDIQQKLKLGTYCQFKEELV